MRLWFPDRLVWYFVLAGSVLFSGLMYLGHLQDSNKIPLSEVCASALGGAVLGLLIFGATMPLLAWYQMGRQSGLSRLGAASCVLLALLAGALTLLFWLGVNTLLPWLGVLVLLLLPFTILDIIRTRRLRDLSRARPLSHGTNLPIKR